MNPVVSILTPSFNRADVYPQTLASLQAQEFTSWEQVIVDDGSTDDCLQQMRQLISDEPRVRLIERDREPKGACACRNIALERSSGKYLIFLDTDDLLAPHCLEQRVAVMEQRSGIDFAVFPMIEFDTRFDDRRELWGAGIDAPFLNALWQLLPICQGTGTIWRREAFERIGRWNESLAIWQDIELHLRAIIRGARFEVSADSPPDGYLRRSPNSLSRGGYHSRPKLESRIHVMESVLDELQKAGRSGEKSDLRWILCSVAVSAARSRQYDLLNSVLNWSANHQIVTPADRMRLAAACWLLASRMARLPGLQPFINRLLWSYRPDEYPKVRYHGELISPFRSEQAELNELSGSQSC